MMNIILNAVFAIVLLTLFAGCANDTTEQEQTNQNAKFESVSPAVFKEKVDAREGILLDVRTPGEYESGHIADALLMDFNGNAFNQNLAELDKNETYLIYCRSDNRSMQTAEMMKKMGFEYIINLEGGILNWEKAGFEVVQ